MKHIEGQPILIAAEMRAAEDRAVAAGTSPVELMERAGHGIAEAVRRLGSGAPVLVLCGPGNNGGDGYVAARLLRDAGIDVRVAASAAPTREPARAAGRRWTGAVEAIETTDPAPVLIDALFGTGLSRALERVTAEALLRLAKAARLTIAVDFPSGVDTDTGQRYGEIPHFDVTLALGAVKPAHMLQPAARFCGHVRLIEIGVTSQSRLSVLALPKLPSPGPDAHKYNRGMVAIIGGSMPGAAALASEAAMRAGAGYVLLLAQATPRGISHALVHKPWSTDALDDDRIGAVLIGPGLGRDDAARERLDAVLASARHLVIDGDAIHLLADGALDRLKERGNAILTPHAGEFTSLFGNYDGSKIDATRKAADHANTLIVHKGPDTVIAAPGGSAIVAPDANDWLSTAGTGDVLAGAIAAMVASLKDTSIEAAAAGVWLHGEAARRLGAAFIADDLARALSEARAAL